MSLVSTDPPATRLADQPAAAATTTTTTTTATTTTVPAEQKGKPVIGVTMGSDTDLATLRPGLALLEEIGIPYECTITSAHRTPQHMLDYARTASSRGLKCIIAAAGGAAHLPGMLASCTSLPVIGVPVKASSLDGLDSLLSIVQMPRGIPVGTMSIGSSVNAVLYAARIVGTGDERVRTWVETHLQGMDQENMEKKARLEREGWRAYVKKD